MIVLPPKLVSFACLAVRHGLRVDRNFWGRVHWVQWVLGGLFGPNFQSREPFRHLAHMLDDGERDRYQLLKRCQIHEDQRNDLSDRKPGVVQQYLVEALSESSHQIHERRVDPSLSATLEYF